MDNFFKDLESYKRITIAANICNFDIPDIITTFGPLTAKEINAKLSVRKSLELDLVFQDRPHTLDEEALERVLRAAAASGLLTESKDRKFGSTPSLEFLTSNHPSGSKYILLHVISDRISYLPWSYLRERMMDPHFNTPQKVYGGSGFEFMEKNPFELHNFHQAMKSASTIIKDELVKVYDFSKFKTVVDIGGSTGHLIKRVLQEFPQIEKGINFDLPKVIEIESKKKHDEEGINGRLEWVPGNFFEEVVQADCYLIKSIFHDWSDEDVVKILKNIGKKINEGGVVLVIECVINEFGNTDQFLPKLIDLQMMLTLNSKERRRDQWEELFSSVGFKITQIISLESSKRISEFIIEAKKI